MASSVSVVVPHLSYVMFSHCVPIVASYGDSQVLDISNSDWAEDVQVAKSSVYL